jgi:hypothetical protein
MFSIGASKGHKFFLPGVILEKVTKIIALPHP